MNSNYNMNIARLLKSLTYIGDDIWTIDYTDPYYLDDILGINDPSFSNVLRYLSKEKDIPVRLFKITNKSKGFAFNIKSNIGVQSLAHNFDAQDGPCLVLWTAPENGLRSMALVNPNILFSGFLNSKKFSQRKMLNTLLAPYTCISGINEAGIAITAVSSDGGIVKQKRGKSVITPYIAIRAILDKCKTIDDAIDFLKSYDMHETASLNYNYQILDSKGKCILVEYTDKSLKIKKNSNDEDFNIVTSYEDEEHSQIDSAALNTQNGIVKTNEIMKMLSNSAIRPVQKLFFKPISTLWSAVYGCNTNSLSLCFRMNYDVLYYFSINNPGEFTKYNVNLGDEIVNSFDITSNDSSIILKANNVFKTFGSGGGKVHALNDVNLKIKRGELLVIIGNSGSGKSTLLNILGGMDKPDKGKIFVEGHDISRFDDNELTEYRKKNIGFIFQSFNLINELTALENVSLSLDVENDSKALALLDLVGLKEKANKYPSNLSGGEQQRVSIARALAKNPKILFCDEPTGSLDYQTGKQILIELEKMAREKGKTVVIVTHTREVGKMADRVIYMKNGKIENVVTNSKPVSAKKIEW